MSLQMDQNDKCMPAEQFADFLCIDAGNWALLTQDVLALAPWYQAAVYTYVVNVRTWDYVFGDSNSGLQRASAGTQAVTYNLNSPRWGFAHFD